MPVQNDVCMDYFEKALAISEENIEFRFRGISNISWINFILNPRRLRGSDFLMRWSQGVWSEKRLLNAINSTDRFYSIPYGPSGTAPNDNVREFELYFERLEAAGLRDIKRPDLLVFKKQDRVKVDNIVDTFGGYEELPFIKEKDLGDLLGLSMMAIECENSL